MSAWQRVTAVLDPGSFERFPDTESATALVLGEGRLDGKAVLVSFLDGRVQGGTVGSMRPASWPSWSTAPRTDATGL